MKRSVTTDHDGFCRLSSGFARRVAILAAVGLWVQSISVFAAQPVFSATDCIPPTNSSYIAGHSNAWQSFPVPSAPPAVLRNPVHSNFSTCITPPGFGGTATHNFTSMVAGEVSLDGVSWIQLSAPATASIRVTWNSQVGGTRYFDCELLQLDVIGGTLPAGMRMRESASKASLGTATVTDTPGGYLMASTFDVWMELSISNGLFWHASTISGPLVLVGPIGPEFAVSRKTHSGVGSFDIDLLEPLGTADKSVECRVGGSTQVVVGFDRPMLGTGGLDPTDVTVSSGQVTAVSISGYQLTVTMSGANQADTLVMQFPGLVDMLGTYVAGHLCYGNLQGDADGDGGVNVFDMVQIRNQLSSATGTSNFRCDANLDGVINLFDLVIARNSLATPITASCP